MGEELPPADRARVLQAYFSLTKPELTLLSVITAVGAAYLASSPPIAAPPLLLTFAGTALVGGGAGALNQYIERELDRSMKRTEQRSLPTGRVSPRAAAILGLLLLLAGIAVLGLWTTPLAGLLAIVTSVVYLLVYTPLKKVTPFAIVLGGIPGALPPVIGWVAVRNDLGPPAWALFFILYFWQMPHFLALAWMYRQDYARGGFKTLTVVDPGGRVVRRQMLVYSVALLPAALMPGLIGMLGPIYLAGAAFSTLTFLWAVVRFCRSMENRDARGVFFGSIALLVFLMGLMALERTIAWMRSAS
jgi:protoheme IX farnesyltransferase